MRFFPSTVLKLLIGTALLFVVWHSTASSQTPHQKIERLVDEIQKTLDTAPPKPKDVPVAQPDHSRMLLASLRMAIERDDLAQTESVLQQLAIYLEPKALRTDCEKASAEIRALRDTKEKQANDALESTFKRTTESIQSAQQPSDLDATLLELKKLRLHQRSDSMSSRENAAFFQVDPAIQFVTYWQNYLAQSAAGDAKAVSATLDRILEITQVALLPRSEILVRRYGGSRPSRPSTTPTPPGHDFAEILLQIKTPQELVSGLDKLVALYEDPRSVSAAEKPVLQHIIESLTPLAVTYREFESGLPTKLEIVLTDPTRREPIGTLTASLRAQMIRLVLPRYLGLPKEIKVGPDEEPLKFLQGVIKTAGETGDFALAVRARDAQVLIRDGKTEVPSPNSQGGNLFVIAQNQELAGQFDLAVTSYERALASGMDIIPPKIIGDKLARIKAEHPAEFAKGMTEFLNPRMPMPPPGYEDRFGPIPRPYPTGAPRGPAPPPRPALDVPGETPGHSATPSPSGSKSNSKP